MSKEKTKIEKLYEDEKSRGFVNHLIHAYLPIYKITKVWEFKDKNPVHKCSVCDHELIDLEIVLGRMQNKEYAKEFVDQLRKDINGEKIKYEDHFMVKHITHGAIMAFTGEKTTTNLCQPCIQNLLDMVQTGLLMDDKNIIYQVNKMKRNTMFNSFTESPALNPSEIKVVKNIQKKVEDNKKHKATFADFEILQQLKQKI
jgi:hypothetical protein